MQLKIVVVELQLSARTKRAIRYAALSIAVFLGTAATVAIAREETGSARTGPFGVSTPQLATSWIDAGAPVSASALLGDLTSLDSRLSNAQNQLDHDGTYALNADFCGESTASFNGAFVDGGTAQGGAGWVAAKAACVAAGGSCGSTAHMCTTEELVRHFALGGAALTPSSNAWFASGILGTTPTGGDSDCYAWTVNGSSSYGGLWGGYYSTSASCGGATYPIACCDWQ